MLKTADYLRVPKRGDICAACDKSLFGEDHHLSILLDPEEARAWDAEREEAPQAAAAEEAGNSPATGVAEKAGPDVETSSETSSAAEPAPAEASAESPPTQGPASESEAAPEEEPGYRRLDFCQTCWEALQGTAFFSFWKGRHSKTDLPPRKLNRAERNQALLALFDSLAERGGQENDFAPHLYFLAHLLMKYKLFKWQPSDADPESDPPLLRFARSDADEEVRIADVEMPSEMVARIKEEVEAYLEESTGQPIRL